MIKPKETMQFHFKDYRVQSGMLIALTGGILFLFW